MRFRSPIALLPCLLLAAACASGAARAPRHTRDQSVITLDELRESQSSDLMYAVLSLRPNWLNKRGPQSFNAREDIVVYVDNMRYGTDASLRTIDILVVERLQFLSAPQAQLRFGLGHTHGAILVFTRRGLAQGTG